MGAAPDGPDAGPEPVASVVAYLIKPEAYFITGQFLVAFNSNLCDNSDSLFVYNRPDIDR